MTFVSFHFAAFFAVVVLAYFSAPVRFRNALVLGASLYAFGLTRPVHVLQLLAAIGIGFWAGLRLEGAADRPAKQRILWISLVLILGDLVVFKYLDFFGQSLSWLLTPVVGPGAVPTFNLLLPIGISFYTFQLVSYLADVYFGRLSPERDFIAFAAYVTFFPKLASGPIERGKDLLPQFHAPRHFDYTNASFGLQLMAWGMFKKVVIADRVAPLVELVYGSPSSYGGGAVAMATFFFACQVYCDFSGYTDMALGAAQVLGFRLSKNFNRPYCAISIQDFWKRWHITLSSWLTDYVFTPLSRSRTLGLKWHHMLLVSLLVTFGVSGLWHGAKWTYVCWGLLHGIYMVTSTLTQPWRFRLVKGLGLQRMPWLHWAIRVGITFTLVSTSYLLFRADSLAVTRDLILRLGSGWGTSELFFAGRSTFLLIVALVAFVILVEWLQAKGGVRLMLKTQPAWIRWSVYYAGALAIAVFGAFYEGSQQFLYFQF